MKNICFLDAGTVGDNVSLVEFEKFGKFTPYQSTKSHEVLERIRDAHIVLTNKVVLNAEVLKEAKNLELIAISATGTNNVDLNYCHEHNIAVTNVAGYSTNSVAQHTFAMLFYLLENLSYYDKYVKSREYAASPFFTHLGRPFFELTGKNWGIIGLGNIGRKAAEIAKAFGCNVTYYSSSGLNISPEYERITLEHMLKESDIISIHAPLNEKTLNLISYAEMKMMKKEAILINAGRGGIVNEEDAARALNENLIRGFATDVLVKEPLDPECPLLKVENPEKVFITPHIAWASDEAIATLLDEMVLNIKAFYKGELRNRV